jgi:hypothetical protein
VSDLVSVIATLTGWAPSVATQAVNVLQNERVIVPVLDDANAPSTLRTMPVLKTASLEMGERGTWDSGCEES